MSEETSARRVIRVIAKNKKMALEELCAATRFDDLKMDSLDALNMIFAFNCRRFSSQLGGAQATCLPVLAASRNDISVGKLGW
jgi:hypothetical protein